MKFGSQPSSRTDRENVSWEIGLTDNGLDFRGRELGTGQNLRSVLELSQRGIQKAPPSEDQG
jgi:hypothetical protein